MIRFFLYYCPPAARRIIFAAYFLALTVVSLLPQRNMPEVQLFPNADKVIHIVMYAGLTFLFFWVWPVFFKGKRWIWILFAVFCWGFLMEIFQKEGNSGRQFDLLDQAFNLFGFVPGYFGGKLWMRHFVRNNQAKKL